MVSGAKSDSIIDANFINVYYNIYSYICIWIYKLIQMRTQQFVRCHRDSSSQPPASDTESLS